MKLIQLYRKAIQVGISNDLRSQKEINRLLAEEKKKFADLDKQDKPFFDQDRFFNPYPDSRILTGDPETKIKAVIAGIDMEASEILLAYILNKESNRKIDLVVSHHPEGYALAQLYDVMKLQADYLALSGVNISVAEKLLEKRISEVERRLLPTNHNRAVSVARLLNLPMICLHTPADNCVSKYLSRLFAQKKPHQLKDLLKILIDIPEYRSSALSQVPPKIVNGSKSSRCGKIFVDMTGGTSGSKAIYQKCSESGIGTIVGMHMGEEHLEEAKKANLNVVIAGHIPSDNLGLNLLFDEVEGPEQLEFIEISGFERIRRKIKDKNV